MDLILLSTSFLVPPSQHLAFASYRWSSNSHPFWPHEQRIPRGSAQHWKLLDTSTTSKATNRESFSIWVKVTKYMVFLWTASQVLLHCCRRWDIMQPAAVLNLPLLDPFIPIFYPFLAFEIALLQALRRDAALFRSLLLSSGFRPCHQGCRSEPKFRNCFDDQRFYIFKVEF